MNELFDYIGMEGSAYLNYLHDVKKEYNIMNPVYTGNDDELVLTTDVGDDPILTNQKQVEYYMRNVKKVR